MSEIEVLKAAIKSTQANLEQYEAAYLPIASRTTSQQQDIRNLQEILLLKERRLAILESTAAPQVRLDSAVDLASVHPDIQKMVFSYVVQISVDDDAATAIVVAQTDEFLFLLTNLHVFNFDESDCLSNDFQSELKKFNKNTLAAYHSKRRKRSIIDTAESPKVIIRRLREDGSSLEMCLSFNLFPENCYKCFSYLDFAIIKAPKLDQSTGTVFPNSRALQTCPISQSLLVTSQHVHIFGFPGALASYEKIHSAIIPAEITGQDGQHLTLSSLSSPGLSGSAIICTVSGIPIGYLGGGLDSASKNQQYQSYGYSFYGIKGVLPVLD